jgi:hypothetical protein
MVGFFTSEVWLFLILIRIRWTFAFAGLGLNDVSTTVRVEFGVYLSQVLAMVIILFLLGLTGHGVTSWRLMVK